MHPSIYRLSFVTVLLAARYVGATTVDTLDDIDFWTGEGENRAAIVIDWDSASAVDEAVVWGFRWTGIATGEDMLRATLAADPRLYAKLGTSGSLGLPVYGLGYDLNDDSEFGITDGSSFDEQGITTGGIPDPPPQVVVAASVDSEDRYTEGFFTGFWHYAIGSGDPFDAGNWLSSGVGASDRVLVDGGWDSWAFEKPPSLMSTAFAENPVAAEVPYSADFDTDDDVDGSDFLTWQRGFGITAGALLELGDANGDGAIDAIDLQIWASAFGSPAALVVVQAIPEPSSFTLVFLALFLFLGTRYFGVCRTLKKSS